MKNNFLILLMIYSFFVKAQSNQFESKWIKNEDYSLIFYSVNDSTKTEIAKVNTSIKIENDQIIQMTTMNGKMLKNEFIDITVNSLKNLTPILHSSNNDQRLLTVAYGDTINGIYRGTNDKLLKLYTDINRNGVLFLDSSFYQTSIRWLPLKDGYTTEIPIYNYDPNKKSGQFKVMILNVTSENFVSKKSGIRKVWKVTELYEISGTKTVHYIDKVDRTLWKQELGGGKLVMLRVE